jgi:stress response protein YsnF
MGIGVDAASVFFHFHTRRTVLAYEKLVAAYDTVALADKAKSALIAAGVHPDDISILDKSHVEKHGGGLFEPKLWHLTIGPGLFKHEADVYHDTVHSGGAVLTARVPDNEVAHISGVLDLHSPVDVHDRAVTSGLAPLAHVDAVAEKLASVPLAPAQVVATTPKIADVHGEEVLKLAEETLQVGKERVETGETRVRRFTTVREVSEDVTLHEEHAEVMRRAISEPVSLDSVVWADAEIEVVESAEHALVGKTARIVEEIGLKSVGSDHVETIHEKLRRQQAEVVHVDPTKTV